MNSSRFWLTCCGRRQLRDESGSCFALVPAVGFCDRRAACYRDTPRDLQPPLKANVSVKNNLSVHFQIMTVVLLTAQSDSDSQI